MFADLVYAALREIPKGKVTTYKALATAVGKPKAARAVGNVLSKNPYAPAVPCHRVIKSNGEVGGFAYGVDRKVELLKKEGILIANGRVPKRFITV